MKIAICLLTNEPEYLHEWLDHHRNYGFDNFIIYCDGFKPENLGDDVVVEKVNPTRSVL